MTELTELHEGWFKRRKNVKGLLDVPFKVFLNCLQHKIGISTDFLFPFIYLFKYIVLARWKMLIDLLINYNLLKVLSR